MAALEWDLGNFSDSMILEKKHVGAADPLTLLPVATVMRTLLHSAHHCLLFFCADTRVGNGPDWADQSILHP